MAMGIYLNPGNESFRQAVRSAIYVDKTGLLEILNSRLGTEGKCIALSHARRFGKSQAAGMIDAYYSLGCDSRALFSQFEIASKPDFITHLNQYNVIHLDISGFADQYKENIIEQIIRYLYDECRVLYPRLDYSKSPANVLGQLYDASGIPFVIIIDEWDCVVRNFSDDQPLVHRYLQFLHMLFKSEESRRFLALAYITGILPVKKIRDESALNNFREYTMLNSRNLAPYFGFTEAEVSALCRKYGMDTETIRQWYDGYIINGLHMYNPNSVYQAMLDGEPESYWKNTSSFSSVNDLITMNFDGLKENILKILEGGSVRVNTETFRNDLSDIRSGDEALTALIHLGYLGYDAERGTAFLPNFEVGMAYQAALATGGWDKIAKTISSCEELLWAAIDGDAEKVAELLELAHDTYCSILKYNDENSLACAVTMAFFTAPAYYNIIRELPAGKGFADFAFVPRREAGSRPAMIVELKWNRDAETALSQIRSRNYAGALKNYGREILLVGISYDKDSPDKKHRCIIESFPGNGASCSNVRGYFG